jgi:hypothetical protein
MYTSSKEGMNFCKGIFDLFIEKNIIKLVANNKICYMFENFYRIYVDRNGVTLKRYE